MSRIKWPKTGTIVRVTFIDHLIHDSIDEQCHCLAYGEFVKTTSKSVILRHWRCLGLEDNDEFITLIKGAVVSITEFEEKKQLNDQTK